MKNGGVTCDNCSATGMAERPLGATASVAVSLLLIAIMAAFFAVCSNYGKAGDEVAEATYPSERNPICFLELTNIDGILRLERSTQSERIQNSSQRPPMTARTHTTKLTGNCSAL